MKKPITIAVLTVAMLLPHCNYVRATENIYLNNEILDSLRSDKGQDRIAVRSFFEAAGYTVLWNEKNNCVTIFSSDKLITLYADNNVIFLNQTGFFLNDNITYVDDSLVMPVDAVKILLNASVQYKDNNIYITTSETNDSTSWKYEVLTLTNAEREKNGLNPLVWNPELEKAAENHCRDMILREYFSHESPEGLTPFDRMKNLGIKYVYAAENIAAGQPDPKSVVEAWMNSEGHKKNILNPNLKEMGAAFVRGGRYGIYWAQELATTI